MKLILCSFALTFSFLLSAQTLTTKPDSAAILMTDVLHFWEAFDESAPKFKAKYFQQLYLDKGSKGVEGFMKYRIQNAKKLAKTVKANEAYYRAVRPYTLRIEEMIPTIRQHYHNLKDWYPEAVYPAAYFVIGRRSSGGTVSSEAIIMGAEMFGDEAADNGPSAILPFANMAQTVTHELIHYQQNYPQDNRLIAQNIKEGSADFLANLISGADLYTHHLDAYAKPKAEEIWQLFQEQKDKNNWAGWLYGGNTKLFSDAPNDLGYWLGFQITAAYYRQAEDKKEAVREILQIKDFDAFLEKSNYSPQDTP